MTDLPIRVLLVEDNPGDARLLREALAEADGSYQLEHVARLDDALPRLHDETFDVVLLDLSLPDSQGLETFRRLREGEEGVPVLVLTGLDDHALSAQAVRQGAQDYLVKGRVDGDLLARSIRYGIERNRLLAEMRSASLSDELTKLLNRRGLLTLAAPLWKSVARLRRGLALVYIDLDGMKQVNDTLGHGAGDRMLIETAHLLQETFRAGDLKARLGGDEFAVLAVGATPEQADLLSARLVERVAERNAAPGRDYPLALSVGLAHYDLARPSSLEDLLARADALMYQQKQARRRARAAS